MKVHHQASVLWCSRWRSQEDCDDAILEMVSKVVQQAEIRRGESVVHGAIPNCSCYEASWRDGCLSVGGGGLVGDEWLAKAGFDPMRQSALLLGLALERCAMIDYGIDDARKLWQPPYVPEK